MATYLNLPGVSGSYVSTPDAAALDITGDVDLRAKVACVDYTPAASNTIIGKWVASGNQRSYQFYIDTTGKLGYQITTDGTTLTILTYLSSVATGLTDGSTKWLRATHNATGLVTRFYTSDDGSTWSQLGTDVVSTNVVTFSGSAILEVGTVSTGTANFFIGKVFRAQVRNNVLDDGTGIQFDADFTIQPGAVATFIESSSNAATVTMHVNGKLTSNTLPENYRYVTAPNGISVSERIK